MIIGYSKNPLKQTFGVVYWNLGTLLFFTTCATLAYVLCHELNYHVLVLPAIPVTILGGALAIFLGFKNSSAYDRWWEARKIWGAIVNDSRSIGMEMVTYGTPGNEQDNTELKVWIKTGIYRQIGWTYALRSKLRGEKNCEELEEWLSETEVQRLKEMTNIPTQILVEQGKHVSYAFKKGWIEEFRFNALMSTIKKLYDDQGKCERIKNTVFPFYYNYFTNFFLWLFTLCLPFALVGKIESMLVIPVSVAISFAFAILNKTGIVTETPFEGRASDTPMSSICRAIEIDLMEMIDEMNTKPGLEDTIGRFGVIYKS